MEKEKSNMQPENPMSRRVGFFLGLALFLAILIMPTPTGLEPIGQKVLAVAVLMATWWGTEAIPIPITSLLPIALFPVLNISGAKPTTGISMLPSYAHWVVYLVLGVFVLSAAIVKWNLHKRIALHIIRLSGNKPSRVVLGFMVATAFISMWMSNTTATAMMLPVAISILVQIDAAHDEPFGKCLMLAIPFSATIGGIGTIIGTGTNLTGVALIKDTIGLDISFYEWMMKIGLPFVILIIPAMWFFMTKYYRVNQSIQLDTSVVNDELKKLGKMSKGEKLTVAIFLVAVVLWLTKTLYQPYFPMLGDETIAMLAAVAPFIIPVDFKKGIFVMDIKTAIEKISWGTLLLIGGALTIGGAFASAGCAAWIASGLGFLEGVPMFGIVMFVALIVAFLTEVTTNMVVVAAFLPMLVGIAESVGVSPFLLMLTATIASSFAFMLPPATPPNAIAYGTGYIEMKDLIKTGFWVKVICLVIFPIVLYLVTLRTFPMV
jgi:sodium-dependent dicarboxylate transporter 2/3/5